MISFEEAVEVILETAPAVGTERIGFRDALGRVLREDVHADLDLPPFNRSAMDGYAIRSDDLHAELEIIETIPAGTRPSRSINPGQCSKIMTGAMIPEGADMVLMIEDTVINESGKVLFTGKKTKSNIIGKAEDIKKGEKVLSSGLVIQPQHIAVLATVGLINPLVSKKVRVGILSTGNEIIEPDQHPQGSQIRNSNAYQLMTQAERCGASVHYYGIAEDDEGKSLLMIQHAREEQDIIILTGGVSMGDFDLIPRVMEDLNFDIRFRTVSIQPGKPTVYGIYEDKRIFGLPGNPVSSFNTFELFVKPLIYRMAGAEYMVKMPQMKLSCDYQREKSSRMTWIPVKINADRTAQPLEYHGSAHILSLVEADGIISIPVGVSKIEKGAYVDVRLI